ncbi:MAG: 1-deoxy-D-xylulose-5-phosphate synthase [Kiritimatiellae bacterium]|nr:1-deoxy-D-xylulose-5-phosphate synthase [Kiritimatiellia bacterium]
MAKSEEKNNLDLVQKSNELRRQIISTVAKNGGHLASSLGAVEIAVALNEVFDPISDRIVWDVGHQAYAWKLLTGRAEVFDTLRKHNGIAPFPTPNESAADAAVAGHAGAALSVSFGMACARDRLDGAESVVAVVGDGALANGMSFEALNSYLSLSTRSIVILNDNEMSISKSIGASSRFLGRLISGVKYNRVKAAAENVGHAMRLTFLRNIYHRIESRIKSLFLGNRYFEEFGLRYIGPVDGHDINALVSAFTVAKEDKRGVIVHVVTKKGYGFAPAETNPTKWHGVDAFNLSEDFSTGSLISRTDGQTWSTVFGRIICDKADVDSRIVALTAGMTDGTGLAKFSKAYPSRFFDVGIAEGHMIAMAAGLASRGMRPVVSIYSTFLQRAIDQVMHDVAISSLPVIITVDRAGVVGADGKTHQGLYDYAMLKCLPNLVICQPRDAADLELLIDEALKRNGPTLIRYPRGLCPANFPLKEITQSKVAIWATADWYDKACQVSSRVGGTSVCARYLKPFDFELLAKQRADGALIVSIENGCVLGGFGETIGADLKFGWPDVFIEHGSIPELEKKYKLDVDSIVAAVEAHLKLKETS